MRCHNCSDTKLAADPVRGLVYCSGCGVVQEEDAIVSSLDFSEDKGVSRLTGRVIQITETFTKVGKAFIQTTSFYIENKIQNICSGLGLGKSHACSAFRCYKLAQQHNIPKGKSVLYTLCACIYIVCRQEKTPHMLVDFSAFLRIDVYKIGKVFLSIIDLLGVRIPMIDPSLYLPRFVTKLGIKNASILEMSMRLVGRMKRDWIVVGRRPNNLCGAALLVSCRIFGEERSIEEVARVVSVSTTTINKRLKELCDTESADLSVREFFSVWLQREEEPPVIKRRMSSASDEALHPKTMGNAYEGCDTDSCFSECADADLSSTTTRGSGYLLCNTPNSQITECEDAYIDDREIEDLLLTKDESEKRENVWNKMYGEYMAWRETKSREMKRVRKKRQRRRFGSFSEAVQSCIKEKKLSRKINFEAIKKLFE